MRRTISSHSHLENTLAARESKWSDWLQYAWPMLAPLLLGVLVLYFLREPLTYWREGDRLYDEQAMKEWLREARIGSHSLPELVRELLVISEYASDRLQANPGDGEALGKHQQKRAEIKEMQSLIRI
jgi:hypothetical protein